MTDREAFLRHILKEPGCDAHRLVFADWLDEHGGQPDDRVRAHFIRGGVQLASFCDSDPQVAAVFFDGWQCMDQSYMWERKAREYASEWPIAHDLWNGTAYAVDSSARPNWWLSCLAREIGDATGILTNEIRWDGLGYKAIPDRPYFRPVQDCLNLYFRRGFVEKVGLPKKMFHYQAGNLFHLQPITDVIFTDVDGPTLLENGPHRGSWFWAFRNIPDYLRFWFPCQNKVFSAHFPSESFALAVLSRAAVNYGRARANLLPLPDLIPEPAVPT